MSKAVAKVDKDGTVSLEPIPQNDSSVVLGMIDKIIANPDVPVERVEQMFNLHTRVMAEEARKRYAIAMAGAQKAMLPVQVDAYNPQTKGKYASFDALDRMIRPIYTQHGLAISWNTETPSPDVLRVIAYVSHEAGHEREFKIDMPADGRGAKGGDVMTKTHATGSAFTYGRRYLLGGIFNVATTKMGANDDDGNAANGGLITPEQAEELAKLITETKSDIHKFLEIGGLESLSDMPAKKFPSAKAMLLKKKEAKS